MKREGGIPKVTEEMVDRVMSLSDGSCPLCDYDGIWTTTMSKKEHQRQAVRCLLEEAILPPK